MNPTTGRILHYTLSDRDARMINRRRTTGDSIGERIATDPPQWPVGAQAHIGQPAHEGDVLPMIVTKVLSGDMVNGQVFLDGNDTLYKVGVSEGTGPESWAWPPRN